MTAHSGADRAALGKNRSVDGADLLFEQLPEEERRALRAASRRRRFSKGDTIFFEGDPGDSLHVIEKGHVAIRVTSTLGDEVTLTVIGPRESFGDQALTQPDARRSASAVCLDAVETLSVGRREFDDLRGRLPAVDRFLVAVLSAQVRRLSSQLLESLHTDADVRVYRRIVQLTESYAGSAGDVVIPLTQDDIASLAGTTRQTVNQALKAAEQAGIVSLGRGRTTVHYPERLAKLARLRR